LHRDNRISPSIFRLGDSSRCHLLQGEVEFIGCMIKDVVGKTWEYLSPSSSLQQDTALAARWHGGSGSSTLHTPQVKVLHPLWFPRPGECGASGAAAAVWICTSSKGWE